jgi:hypothetical protein
MKNAATHLNSDRYILSQVLILGDRGWVGFKRLGLIGRAGAFFVTRAKNKLGFSRPQLLPVLAAAVRSEQIGRPTLPKARAAFPALLRKFCCFDAETEWTLTYLTNPLEIPALTVAMI